MREGSPQPQHVTSAGLVTLCPTRHPEDAAGLKLVTSNIMLQNLNFILPSCLSAFLVCPLHEYDCVAVQALQGTQWG